jgi:hypothetical protein
MNPVRIKDLMPAAREDRLVQAGHERSNAQWVIGDETLDQIEECAASHPEIGLMEIYGYVGQLAGCSARSVRRYASVCRFFSNGDVRQRYDVLCFEYFACAAERRLEAFDFLDLALRMADRIGGRLPGVDWVEREFDKKSLAGGVPDYPEMEREYWEQEAGLLEEDMPLPATDSADDQDGEEWGGQRDAGALYQTVARAAGLLLEALRRLPLPSEVRDRLVAKAEELISEVMEAQDLANP